MDTPIEANNDMLVEISDSLSIHKDYVLPSNIDSFTVHLDGVSFPEVGENVLEEIFRELNEKEEANELDMLLMEDYSEKDSSFENSCETSPPNDILPVAMPHLLDESTNELNQLMEVSSSTHVATPLPFSENTDELNQLLEVSSSNEGFVEGEVDSLTTTNASSSSIAELEPPLEDFSIDGTPFSLTLNQIVEKDLLPPYPSLSARQRFNNPKFQKLKNIRDFSWKVKKAKKNPKQEIKVCSVSGCFSRARRSKLCRAHKKGARSSRCGIEGCKKKNLEDAEYCKVHFGLNAELNEKGTS